MIPAAGWGTRVQGHVRPQPYPASRMELVLYLVAGGTFAAVLLLVLVLQRLWALRLPPDRGAELLAHLGHLKADLAHQRQELASAGAQNFHQLHAMLGSHRDVLEKRLSAIQASTEHRLEQMRQTVDEKLQKTLEARLGESFRLVSERLEAVQKGLGEMKSLADGVGDLKRVMTNVKTRGTWGELQLRALLEDLLRPGEFEANFAPRQRGERVEFAVRLPGQAPDRYPWWDSQRECWLAGAARCLGQRGGGAHRGRRAGGPPPHGPLAAPPGSGGSSRRGWQTRSARSRR